MKLILSLTLVLFSIHSIAQEVNMKIIKTDNFEITGDGVSKNWNKTAWIDIPQRSESDEVTETRAKVLYSDKGMYFLVECEDRLLTASMSGYMKDLWVEDVVEVFLWTDEDYQIYFEYEISPLNEELVLMVPNFDGDFLGWVPWHYDQEERKVKHMTSVQGGKKETNAKIDSWTAEFFIPFELLKPLKNCPPESGMKWRMNIYRMDYDSGERMRWEWKPIKTNFHNFELFGEIVFE